MEETQDQKLMRLRTSAALIQSEVDHSWMAMDERLYELENLIERTRNPLLQRVIELVVVQAYLNRISKKFNDIDEGFYED